MRIGRLSDGSASDLRQHPHMSLSATGRKQRQVFGVAMATGSIADVVRDLGPYATVENLKSVGFSRRAIEAAVRRDVLSWTRDGRLELGGNS